ncbi:MAG TPA: alpha-glucosidase/alpha-galactosidase [Candidatus Limiplasma sp.]|nr:alpha-glucosidase/alpha-galactosidase [Candidatus Limiplasma sp.]
MRTRKQISTDIQMAYIGGGSKGWAWGLMSDLALEKSISGNVRLYDINIDAAKTNEVIGNRLFESHGCRWSFQTKETLKEALANADFVIVSILPGTFDEMAYDVHAPEEFGIFQTVGDTTGPGGLMRALRTIPMYEVIGKAIADYAPDAWVINYTNPMAICVKTLYEVFPDIKVIGCCHEVFGTQKLLAEAAKRYCGYNESLRREDVDVSVIGINHFTWINKASAGGMDLFPAYRMLADEYGETGFHENDAQHWLNSYFASGNRVKFDLFHRYSLIAAAGDRHLVEFLPTAWYLQNPEMAQQWMFSLTPVSWRRNVQQEERNTESRMLAAGEKEFPVKTTGEDGVKIIKALCGVTPCVTNVNMPNTGQVSGVPGGSVVETNALIRYRSVQPVYAGKLPDEINGLVNQHISNDNGIVRAGLARDLTLAYKVFISGIRMQISPIESKMLFDRMIQGTRVYLREYL